MNLEKVVFGFFVLLVPLTLALGYDRIVAASIIFLGAGSGVLCSTVNPFATGVASDAAGISLGDGIGLRLVMWVVLVAMAIAFDVVMPGRSVVSASASRIFTSNTFASALGRCSPTFATATTVPGSFFVGSESSEMVTCCPAATFRTSISFT